VNNVTSGMPTYASMCPPSTITRPSGSIECPAQKRLLAVYGSLVSVSATGSQICTPAVVVWSSQRRTLPAGSSVAWIETSGHEKGPAH